MTHEIYEFAKETAGLMGVASYFTLVGYSLFYAVTGVIRGIKRKFEKRIQTQEQLDQILGAEKEKRGLKDKKIQAYNIKEGTDAEKEYFLQEIQNFLLRPQAISFGHETGYVVILKDKSAKRSSLVHEITHIKNGDCDNSPKEGRTEFWLKYFFYREPRAIIGELISKKDNAEDER